MCEICRRGFLMQRGHRHVHVEDRQRNPGRKNTKLGKAERDAAHVARNGGAMGEG